jgi:acetyl esterase
MDSASSISAVRLEAEIEGFIAQSECLMPPGYLAAPVAEQRRRYRDLCRAFDTGRPRGLEVRDLTAPGPAGDVPLRIYRRPEPEVQACLIYMHGGSWYLGGLDSHDSITAEIADRAGLTVVAVDYRLAPEYRFPAAFEDSYAVLEWAAANAEDLRINPTRIGVGGDSAGGNLAAALCLASHERKGPALRGQLLVYPALDSLDATETTTDGAPLLNQEEIAFALQCYFGAAQTPDDCHAAPLLADDLGGLPPAAVLAAEADPLVADARAYVARLAQAGVPADLEVAPGTVHGFLRARTMSPAAGRAFDWLCEAVRRLLVA